MSSLNLLFAPGRNYASRLRSKNNFARVENPRAFTLIELTLVTAIILALVGLSVPLFRRAFADFTAKDTAYNISKLISYGFERSVIDRKNYRITFDLNRRTYQLFESSISDEGTAYKKIRGRFGKLFGLPQGLSFRDPASGMTHRDAEEYKKQIIFYPDGHCDGVSLEVVDTGGNGYGITLKGFGSTPRIKEVRGG